ncbi:MAG: hypothetical protein WAV90_19275 [Gordonia amarae]
MTIGSRIEIGDVVRCCSADAVVFAQYLPGIYGVRLSGGAVAVVPGAQLRELKDGQS